MKALILNGSVIDLCEAEFEVHPSLVWVDATDETEVGGSYVDGVFGPADGRTSEEKAEYELAFLRKNRDTLLAETDYWLLSDTNDVTQAQLDYRQALRDITDTYSSMFEDGFAWPTKPE